MIGQADGAARKAQGIKPGDAQDAGNTLDGVAPFVISKGVSLPILNVDLALTDFAGRLSLYAIEEGSGRSRERQAVGSTCTGSGKADVDQSLFPSVYANANAILRYYHVKFTSTLR